MTYKRVILRNNLAGNYGEHGTNIDIIAGDLRRLESDSCDENQSRHIAQDAGVDPETVVKVLTAFFNYGYGNFTPAAPGSISDRASREL